MCTTNAEQLGLVSKETVENMFEELMPWDKKEFLEEYIVAYEDLLEKENDYDCDEEDCYEFVRDHDAEDILCEMSEEDLLLHLRDYSTLRDVIEFFMKRGKSWKDGYSKEEMIKTIEDVAKYIVE